MSYSHWGGGPSAIFHTHFQIVDAPDGRKCIDQLNIPVWSSKTFAGEWNSLVPGRPPIEGELRVDNDEISGTLTNNSEAPLRNVYIMHRTGVYRLGHGIVLQPGETREISLRPSRKVARFVEDRMSRGGSGERNRIADLLRGVTVATEPRHYPKDYYEPFISEQLVQEMRDSLVNDLASEVSLRSAIDDGDVIITAESWKETSALDVGDFSPEVWSVTLYRVCDKIEFVY
jgi:hypothetical protein